MADRPSSNSCTKRNYLPKYLVLDLIGKNFRFLDTQLLKIYQILEKIYNWQRHQSFSKFYQKLVNFHPKLVRNLQNFCKSCFQNKNNGFTNFWKNYLNFSKFIQNLWKSYQTLHFHSQNLALFVKKSVVQYFYWFRG